MSYDPNEVPNIIDCPSCGGIAVETDDGGYECCEDGCEDNPDS